MSSTVASLGTLHVLEIAPREERLDGRHHPQVAPEVDAPAPLRRGERTVEDRQVLVLQPRRPFDRVLGVDVVEDPPDLRLVVAELPQRHRHGPVDDLEHPAAGELLVLHQRDVGLDARGVAVHHEGDRAGRGQHGHLAVAVAVLAAHLEALVPDRAGLVEQVGRHRGVDRLDRVAVHLHHPEHRLAVDREAVERPDVRRVLGAGQVRLAVHDRRDRARPAPGPGPSRKAGPTAMIRLPRLA